MSEEERGDKLHGEAETYTYKASTPKPNPPTERPGRVKTPELDPWDWEDMIHWGKIALWLAIAAIVIAFIVYEL